MIMEKAFAPQRTQRAQRKSDADSKKTGMAAGAADTGPKHFAVSRGSSASSVSSAVQWVFPR